MRNLGYADESWWANASPEQLTAAYRCHGDFLTSATAAGHEITGGCELRPISTAAFVREGVVGATAGPYAELVEQLGGLYTVRTADLDGLAQILADAFRDDPSLLEIRPVVPDSPPDPEDTPPQDPAQGPEQTPPAGS